MSGVQDGDEGESMSAHAGYPVRVSKIIQLRIEKGQKVTHQNFNTFPVVETYWQVTSTKLIGDCGHKHETEEEAEEQCLASMILKYRHTRWPKGIYYD
jgi:hypothetical protein